MKSAHARSQVASDTKEFSRIVKNQGRTLTFGLGLLCLTSASLAFGDQPSRRNGPDQKISSGVLGLPLSFEANRGQTDPSVKFLARCDGYTLFLSDEGAVFKLRGSRNTASGVLRVRLAGANSSPEVSGGEALPGTANYFIGNDRSKWVQGVATYRKVNYRQVYAGIDLVYYGAERQMEYDFVVAPGANPKEIALDFSGGTLSLGTHGDLMAALAGEQFHFRKPVVYQMSGGKKQFVAGSYRLRGNRVQFQLGKYDHTRALVIDPVLTYFTYLGGSGNDYIGNVPGYLQFPISPSQSIAADQTGNLYVTGFTASTDFPVQSPYQSQNKGTPANGNPNVAFVTKLDPTGSHLIYSTYLGGSDFGQTKAYAIAVDSSGSAYVAGSTQQADFPVTAGAYQKTCGYVNNGQTTCGGGSASAFLTKLSPSGGSLVYSTFLGPGTTDAAYSVAVDSQGQAYIGGISTAACASNDPTACFPTTASAVLPGSSFNGTLQQNKTFNQGSAFISVFDAAGANLLYSSLYGGLGSTAAGSDGKPGNNGATYGAGVAVDASGNFYLAGISSSNQLPVTPGAYQRYFSTTNGNLGRGYVAKFSPVGSKGGSSLLYATFLGGTDGPNDGSDQIGGIAVDAAGDAYVTGNTGSYDFPVTVGTPSSCTAKLGCQNTGFLTKINSTGSGVVWSTLVGASTNCCSGVVAILTPPRLDAAGNVYVSGRLNTDVGFPLLGPLQPASGFGGVFVTKFDPTGSTIEFSTNIYDPANNGGVFPGGVEVDSQGNIYVAGYTANAHLPVTPGAFHSANSGGTDAFVVKINPSGPAISEVANAEGGRATIAPNTWVEIKGVNLAPAGDSRVWQASDFINGNMPTQLDGVSVTVNGKSAYVWYISPAQVNILTSPDPISGSVNVVVTNGGAASPPFPVQAQAISPSFFVFDGTHVAATHANGSFIGPTSLYPGLSTPAKPGETVVIYANGFGPASTPVVSGSPSQSGTLSPQPAVQIGGAAATVQFAGLVAPGEFQFNVIVPSGLPNGDNPIIATYNGASTQSNAVITVSQ